MSENINNEGNEAFLQRNLEDLTRAITSSFRMGNATLQSWTVARQLVEGFGLSWVVWRLAFYIFSSDKKKKLNEGFLIGFDSILMQMAKDPVLGMDGGEVSTREIIENVPEDIIAATIVIYAICKKLKGQNHERIWRPMLEDALVRARIGLMIGFVDKNFGCGRGMLAGFASRCGLVILLATGSLEQAKETLDQLTYGKDISEVGIKIYGCEPLQVSSMLFAAVGCGRSAAFAIASFSYGIKFASIEYSSGVERKWRAAFALCEAIRKHQSAEGHDELWDSLGFNNMTQRSKFVETARVIIKNGHQWEWFLDGD